VKEIYLNFQECTGVINPSSLGMKETFEKFEEFVKIVIIASVANLTKLESDKAKKGP